MQIPGSIRALPATVRLPEGQTSHLLWGLPQRSLQRETLMVGHSLRHQSAVDVRVVGVRVTEETPYSGVLASVYADGDRRTRYVPYSRWDGGWQLLLQGQLALYCV